MQDTEHDAGHLSQNERTWSAAIGGALMMFSLGRGGPVLRTLSALSGMGLLARSIGGHCAVKAIASGQTSVGDAVRTQWNAMSGGSRASDSREFDVQENVEERANPQGVEEGLSGRT